MATAYLKMFWFYCSACSSTKRCHCAFLRCSNLSINLLEIIFFFLIKGIIVRGLFLTVRNEKAPPYERDLRGSAACSIEGEGPLFVCVLLYGGRQG